MEKLMYEYPTIKRKQEALEFINEFYKFNSEINGVGGLNRFLNDYEEWLNKLDKDLTITPSEERVPAITYFLIREKDNRIVGMVNIRLALNETLRKMYGNIGYCIRPTERRKGYNKVNLYLALKVLNQHNISEAVLDCDTSNLGSAKTIQALGGVLTREELINNTPIQFYTIDVKKSLQKYKNQYDMSLN